MDERESLRGGGGEGRGGAVRGREGREIGGGGEGEHNQVLLHHEIRAMNDPQGVVRLTIIAVDSWVVSWEVRD